MKIGLVRRGFSATGGAEKYLQRFASALVAAGHEPVLFAGEGWPADAWRSGPVHLVPGKTPGAFARGLRELKPRQKCDRLFSLERVLECDCYRAGDGVHRAWLERRSRFEPKIESWFRMLRSSHRDILNLEKELFVNRGAARVIANSRMVRDEIVRIFGYPVEKVSVVYNGVPAAPEPGEQERLRRQTRESLGLEPDMVAVLFLGSGWERKGLRFAVDAMEKLHGSRAVLLVAGRGNPRPYRRAANVRFLGPTNAPRELLAAADVFLLPTLYDPFSNASLEAFSFGLPVITTGDNGFAEVLEPGRTGEIIRNPTDTESIAASVRNWMDRDRREALRPVARATAAEFTMERNVRESLAVILGTMEARF